MRLDWQRKTKESRGPSFFCRSVGEGVHYEFLTNFRGNYSARLCIFNPVYNAGLCTKSTVCHVQCAVCSLSYYTCLKTNPP